MKHILLLNILMGLAFLSAQTTNDFPTESIFADESTSTNEVPQDEVPQNESSPNENTQNENTQNEKSNKKIRDEKLRPISKRKEVLKKDREKITIVKNKEIKIDNRNFVSEVKYLTRAIKGALLQKLQSKKYEMLARDIPIVSFNSTPNLRYAHQNTVINRLTLINIKKKNFSFVECYETLNFLTTIKDGKIVISKGVQSKDQLFEVLNEYGSRYYAVAFLELTKKRYLSLTIQFLDAETGKTVLTVSSSVRIGLKDDKFFSIALGLEFPLTNFNTPITALGFLLSFGERIYGLGEVGLIIKPSAHLDFTRTGIEVLQRFYLDFGGQLFFNLNEIFNIKFKNVTFYLGGSLVVKLDFIENGVLSFTGTLDYYLNVSFLIEQFLVTVDFSPDAITRAPIDSIGFYLGFYF